MKIYKIVLCTLVTCTLFLSSCSEYDNRLQYVEVMGYISLKVTDAPFPHSMVSEANITITKVEARLKNNGESNASPYQVLYEGEIQMNLLELTNGVSETLSEIKVPAGSYDLVRVYVKDANVLLTDDRTFDLKVPSGDQTGVKVFIKPELVVNGGLTSELLLDFDVYQSFVVKGDINDVSGITGFNFKPVIKASNNSVSGTLSGTVSAPIDEIKTDLEGAQITIMAADTLNTTTFTVATGQYMVQGLSGGSYKVIAGLDGYQLNTAEEVTIVAGNETKQDFELIKE